VHRFALPDLFCAAKMELKKKTIVFAGLEGNPSIDEGRKSMRTFRPCGG
jgi:hypothetical protein